MDAFTYIAERRIQQAMEEGAFDNLAGKGRPLDFSDDRHVPPELRAVYRVMKTAGVLPPEVELRKEIRRLEDLLPSIRDEETLREAVRHLNEKIAALNMMGLSSGRRSIKGEMAQIYADKLVRRLREAS